MDQIQQNTSIPVHLSEVERAGILNRLVLGCIYASCSLVIGSRLHLFGYSEKVIFLALHHSEFFHICTTGTITFSLSQFLLKKVLLD